MIKKISVLLLVVAVLSTTMIGCQSKKDKDVTITVFQSKVEITEQLEKLAKEYTDMTDGVKVEVWGTSGDDYATQLQTKLGAGQGPTILSPGVGTTAESISGYLYDLSNEDFVKHIAPGMEVKSKDGKLIGVPYGVEGYGFVYNKSLVDASQMTDFASFESTVKALKESGVQPVSLSSESYFLIAHILNVPFALQDDPEGFIASLNDGSKKMSEDPVFEEWATFMEVIRAEGTNPLEVQYDVQTGDFATAKTAMIHQGNWAYVMFTDYNVDFEMGILPMPVKGNDKISVGIPNSWGVNAGASDEEIEAGLAFLNWLFTSEEGISYIIDAFGFIPAMTNMKTDSLDPLGKDVAHYTAEGKTLPWMFSLWPDGVINNDFFPATQKFFSDKDMTGSELLNMLDAAWEKAAQ
ncbi:carbohydrate ABC transporter substrate-binding protein [Vallitalea pronyensis]|uniref:Carbohydrate ABC transporter substrate-binding protein n=1 Tax=Vallitalea pronyensis TaxID=1348613 RepID=A0A8J8MNP0_9FIRM|nr:ABC transporter substrate-binding protein [Vallitalea pronyensis]QUI25160.1 carbohydrate ABC transporter substrate-binding protein [Vallitalea pronyensis]